MVAHWGLPLPASDLLHWSGSNCKILLKVLKSHGKDIFSSARSSGKGYDKNWLLEWKTRKYCGIESTKIEDMKLKIGEICEYNPQISKSNAKKPN